MDDNYCPENLSYNLARAQGALGSARRRRWGLSLRMRSAINFHEGWLPRAKSANHRFDSGLSGTKYGISSDGNVVTSAVRLFSFSTGTGGQKLRLGPHYPDSDRVSRCGTISLCANDGTSPTSMVRMMNPHLPDEASSSGDSDRGLTY